MIDRIEGRAPEFGDCIVDRIVRNPKRQPAGAACPDAYPMHLDITMDQLGSPRRTRP